ncbi:uncharacterized protein LOC127535018 [Acanthochromis polyacanthus]|uniref:uncharacterized protein LOC127535018 n=1 Tax=Acanthochromis polyacanthus TaxID=80966 RepID=UPI00223440AA|nr:uncharacterized protein LOC127535018 [Acanthochromis polyacanthus]
MLYCNVGDHAEASKWLSRYLSGDCDTTDIQSEEECTPQLKRARRPNPRFNSDSDSCDTQERLPQAPRILYPASSSPKTYETLQFGCLSEDLFQKSSVSGTFMEEFQSQSLLAPPTGIQLPQESSPADVAMQRLLTAVSELTKEVRDLRQEFREFCQSCGCGQAVAPVGPQPGVSFDLPLCNLEALDQAEAALQTEDNQGAMTALLAKIGGTTVELKIRRMLAWTLTNELASEINWAGKKTKIHPNRSALSESWLSPSACLMLLFWREEQPHSLSLHRWCRSGCAMHQIGQGGLDALNCLCNRPLETVLLFCSSCSSHWLL